MKQSVADDSTSPSGRWPGTDYSAEALSGSLFGPFDWIKRTPASTAIEEFLQILDGVNTNEQAGRAPELCAGNDSLPIADAMDGIKLGNGNVAQTESTMDGSPEFCEGADGMTASGSDHAVETCLGQDLNVDSMAPADAEFCEGKDASSEKLPDSTVEVCEGGDTMVSTLDGMDWYGASMAKILGLNIPESSSSKVESKGASNVDSSFNMTGWRLSTAMLNFYLHYGNPTEIACELVPQYAANLAVHSPSSSTVPERSSRMFLDGDGKFGYGF